MKSDGEPMLKFPWSRTTDGLANRHRPERRAEPRLDKVFPVWLEGDSGSGVGVARNISEGGMFIETASPHPLASQVRVTFPSHSGDMTAVAEVRYVCHLVGCVSRDSDAQASIHGMGVRFLYFEAQCDRPRTVH